MQVFSLAKVGNGPCWIAAEESTDNVNWGFSLQHHTIETPLYSISQRFSTKTPPCAFLVPQSATPATTTRCLEQALIALRVANDTTSRQDSTPGNGSSSKHTTAAKT